MYMNTKLTFGALVAIIIGVLVAVYISSQDQTESVEDPATTDRDQVEQPAEPATDYIGLSEAAAAERARDMGEPFRVVERDGESLIVTQDLLQGRINAVVQAGVVASYTVEGADVDLGVPEVVPDTPVGNDVIIGMTVAEAEAYAAAQGVPFRLGYQDGEYLAVTMDYRPGRITASVEDGAVFDYSVE